jgi:hypothetical protein
VPVELGFDRGGRVVIGKLQFDRLEARRRRRAKALEQRPLGEEISEVGGKARNETCPV